MKTSPNREQQLFLVAGGTILLLILGVVIFNMVQPPGKGIKKETLTPRPVVVLNSRPDGTTKKRLNSPWISSVSPAAIFSNDQKTISGSQEEPEVEAVSSRTIKKPAEAPGERSRETPREEQAQKSRRSSIGPMDQVGEDWTPNAGSLESARIASVPARKRPLQLAVPKIDRDKIGKSQPPRKKISVPPPHRSIDRKSPLVQVTIEKPVPSRVENSKPSVRKVPKKPAVVAKKSPPSRIAAKRPAVPKSGFSVQVASFSNSANARALTQRLGALTFERGKLPVYRSSVTVSSGKTYHRVRVGPFNGRGQAQRAAQFVRRSANLNGTVMPPGR